MKTAIVHDWLTGMRGGEKVLDLLCEILPSSDLYTMIYVPGKLTPRIEQRRIVTSWLNRLPLSGRFYRYLLPLMPSAASRLKLEGYDLVVAVSHCVAHGVSVSSGTRFVCYSLTPMRYIWDTQGELFHGRRADFRYRLLRGFSKRFRRWDVEASARVGEYVTISRAVQQRVKQCYGRESVVIHPPVDTEFYHPVPSASAHGEYYLWAGALAPYKRIDIVLEAFAKLGRKLVVIGDGQDIAWARRHATDNVTFLGWQPDDVLREYYSGCRALVFPGEEDFGIVPLEVQACGCPVIACGKGGVLDTVAPLGGAAGVKPTGVFFDGPSAGQLVDAVRRFEVNERQFDSAAIRSHALAFSRERCREALSELLTSRSDASS